jgi:hypothetical protein
MHPIPDPLSIVSNFLVFRSFGCPCFRRNRRNDPDVGAPLVLFILVVSTIPVDVSLDPQVTAKLRLDPPSKTRRQVLWYLHSDSGVSRRSKAISY